LIAGDDEQFARKKLFQRVAFHVPFATWGIFSPPNRIGGGAVAQNFRGLMACGEAGV
jgi:hypothetical protein